MNDSRKQPIKLVAIDDDPAALELVREALSQEGVEILTADVPADGLELVSRQSTLAKLASISPRPPEFG